MHLLLILLCAADTQLIKGPLLTSEDHTALYFPYWFEKIAFYNKGAMIAIDGDAKQGEGLSLFRWDQSGWHLLFKTTPREGVLDAQHIYPTADGKQVYLADYQTMIHRWSDQGFQRVAAGTRADSVILLHGQLYQGHKYPHNGFYPPNNQEITDLRVLSINKKLPQFTHPIEGRVYLNQMIFQDAEQQLAVGYRLGDTITVFDTKTGKRLRKIMVGQPFRGYQPVDPNFNFPKGPEMRKNLPIWYGSFHHLAKLAWHQGELYGHFRKGFDGLGHWTRLHKSGFHYNNTTQPLKLLAMGPNQCIWGRMNESEDGIVTWQLYSTSTFSVSPK